MKAKEIKELISFIAGSGLEEVNIETEEIKLSVKRTPDAVVTSGIEGVVPATQVVQAAPAPIAAVPVATAPVVETPAAPAENSNYIEVKSPMIGTFYTSSNPETPAFVEVGGTITKGNTICIIEAMKLFNEIESEVSGKIVEILVDNASPVEYDQPLFLVDPS